MEKIIWPSPFNSKGELRPEGKGLSNVNNELMPSQTRTEDSESLITTTIFPKI